MPRQAPLLFAIASLAGVAACGGSGGGGNPGPSFGEGTFAETYFAVLKTGSTASGFFARATTGTVTSDGAGNAYHTHVVNDNGVVSGPDTVAYEYDVAADGTLDLRVGSILAAKGGLSPDGRIALLGSPTPGASPGVLALLRREGAHTAANLFGPYHYADLSTSLFGRGTACFFGSVDFDGAGAGTVTLMVNGMGTIAGPFSGPLTYTVFGDGTSTLSTESSTLEGGVADDGEIAVWAGGTAVEEDPLLGGEESPRVAVAIRRAISAGLSTLQGDYRMVLLERDPASGEFRSLLGTATSNGAGSLTLVATSNTNGAIVVEPPQTTTYTLLADGTLKVDAGGSLLVGGVTEDGRFGFLGGGSAAGSSPTICFLCRK